MIEAVNLVQTNNIHQKSKSRYLNIKYSGYASLGLGLVCGVTGIKAVKFAHKTTVHRSSALAAGLTALWHLGAIKKWDAKLANFIINSSNNNN